jgi:hypothetical protein
MHLKDFKLLFLSHRDFLSFHLSLIDNLYALSFVLELFRDLSLISHSQHRINGKLF